MTTTSDPAPITRTTITASITAGSIGLLILGVQPVLLGPLVLEQRVSDSGVGYLATIEIVAIALGSVLGLPLLRRISPRVVAVAGGLVLALVNVAIVRRSGLSILLALRALTGLAGGMLVALGTVAAVRSTHPERVAALFLALQTALQLVVAAVMPRLQWQGSRADAGFLLLAAMSLIAIAAASLLPERMRPAAPAPGGGSVSLASGLALTAAATFLGGIVAIWAYLGLWLGHKGHPPEVEGNAVAISLAFQVFGAMVAAKGGGHRSRRAIIVTACLAQACVGAVLLLSASSASLIYAASAAFGFIWLGTTPIFTGLLLEIDPARRAALYIPAAQLAGAAVLPTIAALLVTEGNVGAAFVLGIAMLVVTALLVNCIFLLPAHNPAHR